MVQGRSADNHLVGTSTKSSINLLTNALFYFLLHDGHLQQQLHGIALYLGEHALADNFLNNQWHGHHYIRTDIFKGLRNDGRRGETCQEMQMIARTEWEQEFNSHSIHVGHGQYAQRAAELRHVVGQVFLTEIHITPQCPIGEHDTLRKTCRSAGVVDHAEFFGFTHIPMNIVATIGIGKLAAKQLVQPFTGIGQFFVVRDIQREIGQVENTLQTRHFFLVDDVDHVIAHKQQAAF